MNLARLIARTVRRVAVEVADAPRVAREIRQHHTAGRTPSPLTDVTGTIPEPAQVEQAARQYEQAKTTTNAAARIKRQAEKVLKRTPDGVYGAVTVERFESSRQTADLEAVRAIFKANGLGEIPMKTCSPSLVFTWAAEETEREGKSAFVTVAA